MTFSLNKKPTLLPKKEQYLKTFLLALLTAAVLFVPFMIINEGYFLFYGDFNVQQIPFYKLAHDAILNGETAWNFSTDLGVNLSFRLALFPFKPNFPKLCCALFNGTAFNLKIRISGSYRILLYKTFYKNT